MVDTGWTAATLPDNIPWDCVYCVEPDSGAHQGSGNSADALDSSVTPMTICFNMPV